MLQGCPSCDGQHGCCGQLGAQLWSLHSSCRRAMGAWTKGQSLGTCTSPSAIPGSEPEMGTHPILGHAEPQLDEGSPLPARLGLGEESWRGIWALAPVAAPVVPLMGQMLQVQLQCQGREEEGGSPFNSSVWSCSPRRGLRLGWRVTFLSSEGHFLCTVPLGVPTMSCGPQ